MPMRPELSIGGFTIRSPTRGLAVGLRRLGGPQTFRRPARPSIHWTRRGHLRRALAII